MSASRPPISDGTAGTDGSLDGVTARRPFAWGKSPTWPRRLLERDHELQQIGSVLDTTRSGRATSVLVVGEAGIGKTSLLEAVEQLAHDFRCLWVRGVPTESVLAHAGLLQALGPLRNQVADLSGVQAAALRSALGWGAESAPAERFLVGAAALSLLAEESTRNPVLLIVDDAQWVDRESVSALAFAARRLGPDAVCFVWAARTDAVPGDVARDGLRLEVGGLSAAAARDLCSNQVSDPVLTRLVAETGGNPLALVEISARLSGPQRSGAAELPAALPVGERLIAGYGDELATLSDPARRAVLLTALNRSGTSATMLDALAREGLDPATAVDEALDSGVLVRRGAEFDVRHPLLRTASFELATATERRSAHVSLARVLAAEPGSRAGIWHRAEAAVGADDHLARELESLADWNRHHQGYAGASAAMERAASLSSEPGVGAERLAAAAADAFVAGDHDLTRSLVARVLAASGSDRAQGRALVTLGMLEEYTGSVPTAIELLAAAALRLDGEDRVSALAELALARFRLNDVTGIAACARQIVDVGDPDDPREQMLCDFTSGLAATVTGELEQGGASLRKVIDRIGRPPLRDDPRSLLFLALAGGFVGNPHEVLPLGTRQLQQARDRGALGILVPALTLSATARAWIGDHAGAFADAGEAAELGEQLGYAADTSVALEMLAWQSAARGLHEQARTALDRARLLTDRAGTTESASHQAITTAFCAACRADPATAVAVLEDRIAVDGGVGAMGEPLGVAPELVEAYLALGRRDAAAALAQRYAAVTGASAAPGFRALAARCIAMTADNEEAGSAAFESALAAHTEAPDPFETARTELNYGAALRRQGQRIRAREHLRRARDQYAAMDLTVWSQRAADELAATGANPRDRRSGPSEPLTAQEMRVARQAAQGLTTKDIAAALFLSPKTIEHHLSSIYRKRGVRSRTELAAAMRGGPGR